MCQNPNHLNGLRETRGIGVRQGRATDVERLSHMDSDMGVWQKAILLLQVNPAPGGKRAVAQGPPLGAGALRRTARRAQVARVCDGLRGPRHITFTVDGGEGREGCR
tara:strand:- start:79 stop:399 length:321 start_codon:yes stop_codon:yes gene_type:complete